MNSMDKIAKALADPATHDSLKTAIRAFDGCDPVDAAKDTEWLAEVHQQWLAEVQRLHHGPPPAHVQAWQGQ